MIKKKALAAYIIIFLVLIAGIGACSTWYFRGTARGIRYSKDLKSEYSNGIPREIKVYNSNGKLIMEEKGKFDIKHSSRSLQYVDQHNKKHNIYYGDNATVVVNELK